MQVPTGEYSPPGAPPVLALGGVTAVHGSGGDCAHRNTVVPPEEVRRTEQMLEAAGFPVEFTQMPDRGHAYTSPARLHRQVWTFFQRHQLPSAPIFVEYR